MFEVSLKSHSGDLKVGESQPLRVNCNVGANTPEQIVYERKRLKAIKESNQQPDTFMDLSIGQYEKPLYKEIVSEFGCPVGVVPAYTFPTTLPITQEYALDTLRRLADDGLSFFSLHLTAKKDLLDLARGIRGTGTFIQAIRYNISPGIWNHGIRNQGDRNFYTSH